MAQVDKTRDDELHSLETRSTEDHRRPAYGFGRIVIVIYACFGIVATIWSFTVLIDAPDQAVGPRMVSLLAAVGYLVAFVALAHNGRRMRKIGWSVVSVELTGVFVVGLMGLGLPELYAGHTVWGAFGRDYYYLPVFLPLLGMCWLWWSNPRRIVEMSERAE